MSQDTKTQEFAFMKLHLTSDKGETYNEGFFLGPLPEIGETVEMVYTGSNENGAMKFQLRTKRP